jgi:hypothetical protein
MSGFQPKRHPALDVGSARIDSNGLEFDQAIATPLRSTYSVRFGVVYIPMVVSNHTHQTISFDIGCFDAGDIFVTIINAASS